MPNFETYAPQGYMGDWSRGAPLGRPTIGPDPRSIEELYSAFADACKRLSDALRLKENRPPDGFKPRFWAESADDARDEKEALRAAIKAAQERAGPKMSPKIALRRVYLDGGGYDPAGAYWGIGSPLYWAASDSPGVEFDSTFRACSREEAKAHVRQTYPHARFYN